MSMRNTTEGYGDLARLLHWSFAVLCIFEYATIYCKMYLLSEDSATGGFLLGSLHKPIGVLLLLIVTFAYAWHHLNAKPAKRNRKRWERLLAVTVHQLLYVCLMLMAATGIMLSTAYGYKTSMFGLFDLPLLMSKDPNIGALFRTAHAYLSYLTAGLIVLHFTGLAKQHLIHRDPVIHRMIPTLTRGAGRLGSASDPDAVRSGG